MRGPRYLSTFRKSPEEANAHGWSAYKARHDPPGLSFVDTEGEDGEARFTLTHDPRLSADPSVIEALRSLPVSNVCWVDVGSAMFDTEADARAAAWAWYANCHELWGYEAARVAADRFLDRWREARAAWEARDG
jgi:hypothetical protein